MSKLHLRFIQAVVIAFGLVGGFVSADLVSGTAIGPVVGGSGSSTFTGGTLTSTLKIVDTGGIASPGLVGATYTTTGYSINNGSLGQVIGGTVVSSQTATLFTLNSALTLGFGTASSGTQLFTLGLQTADTPDTGVIGLPATSNGLVIAEIADQAFDFAHAAQTNPTLFVHSANQSTTQWLSLTHNATDGVLAVGTGGLNMASPVFLSTYVSAAGGAASVGANLYYPLLTNQTPDTGGLLTGTAANSFILAEFADATAFDFAHAQATDPTLFIHSHNQSTSEFMSLAHDGTNAVITGGTTGGVQLSGADSEAGGVTIKSGSANRLALGNDGVATYAFRGCALCYFGFTADTNPLSNSDTGMTRTAAGVVSTGPITSGLVVNPTAVTAASTIAAVANVFHISGNTNITDMTVLGAGTCVRLIFDGTPTFTDGNHLKLAGNLVATADDTISLCSDGTNWYETGRSVN